MHYSKYFGLVVKEQGIPHLSVQAFQKFMNIVSLESKISGIKQAQRLDKSQPHRFDMEIFSLGRELTDLTGNMEPKEVLENLIKSGSSDWLG